MAVHATLLSVCVAECRAGEFVVGQEYEARLSKTLLPRVTGEDVQRVADHCRVENSCLVKAIAHRKCVHELQSTRMLVKFPPPLWVCRRL